MTRLLIARTGSIVMLVVVLSAVATFGQQVTGTILGEIADTAGAVIPGAMIQIQNSATGFGRTETTDGNGRYLSSNLPLGSYSVTVQKEGFQTFVRNGIDLSVGSAVTVNAKLVVGNLQEKVEVTAEAPAVETSDATISALVTPEQIQNLPLNGRSLDTLATLAPGVFVNHYVSNNGTTGYGLHLSINGGRQDQNLYLLDGTITNDVNSGRSSAAGQALGVEGVLEFRLVTHDGSAEYGRAAGGVFSAVTRSGTNDFHGSAYEFFRNNVLNSRNFFNPGALPAFHRNQFGVAGGGPVIRNKLFFYANYEGLRQRQGISLISFVPDSNARIGIVNGVKDPSFNPVIEPYLAYYPQINVPGSDVNGVGQSNNPYSVPTNEDYTMGRADYKMSDKDSFFARYVYDPSSLVVPQGETNFLTRSAGHDRFLVLAETHIFSPSTLNEFRASLNRTDPTGASFPVVSIPASLSFVPGLPFGTLTPTSLSALGVNQFPHTVFQNNRFAESDTLTKVWGAHNVKFGVEVERDQLNYQACFYCYGQYTFNGLAALLHATPAIYNQQASGLTPAGTLSNGIRGWRQVFFGSFVQDDIRVRPNLTLNLGLRWEFFTTPSEVSGLSAALLPGVTAPTNTVGPPFISPKRNISPRVGLAWDPTGSGKTSIRLGAGRYDNELTGESWFQNATRNTQFLTVYSVSNGPFPNGLANGTGTGLPQNYGIQHNPQEPTVYEWNFDVQRQLTPKLSLKVGYVGSHGVHLPAEDELNVRIPTAGSNGNLSFASTSPFINPRFSDMRTTVTNGVYSYNGMQVSFLKALSAGLTLQVSYTYSKNLSDSDVVVAAGTQDPPVYMNPFNPKQDYSLSAWDQKHTLVINGAYQMPWDRWLKNGVARAILGGWKVNGIFSYGTGLPVPILDGFNNSLDGDPNNPDRPNLNPGFSNNPTSGTTGAGCAGIPAGLQLGTPNHWYNPCAFSLSPAGTFGNLGRNTVLGPALWDVDSSLVKLTALTERVKFEFRAEAFNLFNHTGLSLPNTTLSSSSRAYAGTAGVITATAVDNRELQFGLKLLF